MQKNQKRFKLQTVNLEELNNSNTLCSFYTVLKCIAINNRSLKRKSLDEESVTKSVGYGFDLASPEHQTESQLRAQNVTSRGPLSLIVSPYASRDSRFLVLVERHTTNTARSSWNLL